MSEQSIVNAILDYLALRRIKAIHHRTTGHLVERDGKRFFGRNARRDQQGAPDILFAYDGQAIALEVKSPTGKQRPEQIRWANDFVQFPNKGLYFIVRSVGNVEDIFKIITAHQEDKHERTYTTNEAGDSSDAKVPRDQLRR